jgi:hypothetical protein
MVVDALFATVSFLIICFVGVFLGVDFWKVRGRG